MGLPEWDMHLSYSREYRESLAHNLAKLNAEFSKAYEWKMFPLRAGDFEVFVEGSTGGFSPYDFLCKSHCHGYGSVAST